MTRRLCLFLLAVCLLSGCTKKSSDEEPISLRIATLDAYTFESTYRDYFDAAFPDWNVSLIELPEESGSFEESQWQDWLDTEKPDLLLTNVFDYHQLADIGLLRDLEEFAGRSDMDLGRFNPAVLDYLKGNEQGRLFGLSPFFSTSALYYNKDLFDRLGIPYPEDDMTWADTLNLAGRFMNDSRLGDNEFGLHVKWVSTPFDLMNKIAYTDGVDYVNSQTGALTIDTDGWRNIFGEVIDAYRNGTFRTQTVEGDSRDGTTYYGPEALAQTELFAQGLAAMTVDGDSLMRNLKAGEPGFRWGVATGPVRASDPSRAGWFGTGYVFAIPIVSSKPERAWESIAYLHSERMGRASVAINGDLLALQDDPVWRSDEDYRVFYRKLPENELPAYAESKVPISFYEPFNRLVDRRIGEVLQGKLTVEEALASIQREGEELMVKAKLESEQAAASPSQ